MIGIEVEVDRRAEIGGLNDLVEESTMICLSLVLVALVVKTSFEKDIMQQDRNRLEVYSLGLKAFLEMVCFILLHQLKSVQLCTQILEHKFFVFWWTTFEISVSRCETCCRGRNIHRHEWSQLVPRETNGEEHFVCCQGF